MYTTPAPNLTYRSSGDKYRSPSPSPSLHPYGQSNNNTTVDTTTTASPATGSSGREAGIVAFLSHFYRLFFHHILPTTLRTLRGHITTLLERLFRWTIMGVQLTFAVTLGGWLLTSAWWIAAAVAIGAWSVTVAVTGLTAGQRLVTAVWPTSLQSWLWRWMNYMTWPLVWLQAWRRQRLHQRQRSQRSRRSRPTSPASSASLSPKTVAARRRPATGDGAATLRVRSSSVSSTATTVSSSGTLTPNHQHSHRGGGSGSSPRTHATTHHYDDAPFLELACGRNDPTNTTTTTATTTTGGGYGGVNDALHTMPVRIAT